MPLYEYKVIPAPRRGEKTRGAKTTSERFAQALATVMNDLGREGWEYQRADTLPCEERVGLTGKATAFHNMLVFRRALAAQPADQTRPAELALPAPMTAVAPEGAAPKISIANPEPVTMPQLGPARGTGLAAE